MDWARIPVVRYIWAWFVRRAARNDEARIPPVMKRFAVGEVVPLKGVAWRVSFIGPHGMVLSPVEFTAKQRKRLARRLEEKRHAVGQPDQTH